MSATATMPDGRLPDLAWRVFLLAHALAVLKVKLIGLILIEIRVYLAQVPPVHVVLSMHVPTGIHGSPDRDVESGVDSILPCRLSLVLFLLVEDLEEVKAHCLPVVHYFFLVRYLFHVSLPGL